MGQLKYNVTRVRRCALAPAYWNAEARTDPHLSQIHGTRLHTLWLVCVKSGMYQFVSLQKNWDEAAQAIAARLLTDNSYIKKLRRRGQQQGERIDNFVRHISKINMRAANFYRLSALARQIHKLWVDYDVENTLPWFIGGDDFREKVFHVLNIDTQDFMFLTTPLERTRASLLDYEFLKSALAVKRDKKNIGRLAKKLSDEFGWLPFGYDGPEYWDAGYFENVINRLLRRPVKILEKEAATIERAVMRRKQRWLSLIDRHNIKGRRRRLLNILNFLAELTDDRKYYHFRLHYHYARILEEFSRRFDVPYKHLKYLFVEELVELRDNAEKLLARVRKRERVGSVYAGVNGVIKVLSKRNAAKLFSALKAQNNVKVSEIKGNVGSRGPKKIYQGTVKIILSPRDGYKIKHGDFIVANMTSPDYIAIMRRAAGFITDEGGVTCHAAIVGREMNKPAIIGTRIATQVLRDGDRVEVDAIKGVVKKI